MALENGKEDAEGNIVKGLQRVEEKIDILNKTVEGLSGTVSDLDMRLLGTGDNSQ